MKISARTAVLTLAAQVAFAGVAVAEPTIHHTRCTLSGSAVDASIRYTEDGGRTLDYRFSVRDTGGSVSLRDDAGRTVASASARADGTSTVALGSSWTSMTFGNLIAVLDNQAVQAELSTCVAPAAAVPLDPWQWFCPILVFVWDEDLVKRLCGFAY